MTEAGLNPRRISIAPLDPEKHDRASFSCGTVRLDNFLKRSARKQQSGDFTRVWVATEGGRDEILGYYALNAHSLELEGLPSGLAKHAPRSGSIPAAYLSMIAVDRRCQGRGKGSILLGNALRRAVGAADQNLKPTPARTVMNTAPNVLILSEFLSDMLGFPYEINNIKIWRPSKKLPCAK